MWRAVMRSFGAQAERTAKDVGALRGTDALLNQLPGGLYGIDLAERRGIPMLLAAVMPLARTRAFPMPAFPPLPLSCPLYNATTYRIAEQLLWAAYRRPINTWRVTSLGLLPWRWWGYFGMMARSTPVLNGFSTHVVPRPPDWGDHVHVTGYWFPDDAHWQPPDALLRFLDAGPPPVYCGFGSMPLRDPRRMTATVLGALRQSGQRGILHTGWADLGGSALPPSVHQIDYAPYRWLFPRVSAVVHHGGSGTTAFGLRAGVPAVVVPFVFDQFFWGRRVAALGVGPRPVPARRLSEARLAAAIEMAVSDAGMRRCAAALGARIRAEDGLAAAVRVIDGALGATSRSGSV
jgi:sterol 3beta-glucosyltransferase